MDTFPVGRSRFLLLVPGILCALTAVHFPVLAQTGTRSNVSEIVAADLLVRSTFAQERAEGYEQAAGEYLNLLAAASRPLGPAESAVLCRHLAQLAPILPEHLRSLLPAGMGGVVDCRLSGQVTAELMSWWRSQDPVLSTTANERVIEHLQRVAAAVARFGGDGNPAGFDDRGTVYVRLGAPSREARIRNEFMLSADAVRMATDFPDALTIPRNEFWTYTELDHAGYLFIDQRGSYKLSTPLDLLASSVRRGFFETERGRARAGLALDIMNGYYDELARVSPGYFDQWISIANALDGVGDGMTGGGEGQSFILAAFGPYPAGFGDLVTRLFAETGREDAQLERRRDASVPLTHSNVQSNTSDLLIDARIARFLNDDGTTRMEVYWAPLPGELAPSASERMWLQAGGYTGGAFVLRSALARFDSTFERRQILPAQLMVRGDAISPEGTIPTRTEIVPGDSGLYHLALEMEQLALTSEQQGQLESGAALKRAVIRFDSLEVLSGSRDVLEMSDVRPVLVPEEDSPTGLESEAEERLRALAYPFRKVRSEAQLGLYFEVYGLERDAQGRTLYSVELEVSRKAADHGLMRIFRRGRDEQVQTATESEGSRPRVGRLLVVDLNDYNVTSGELILTVRVRDEISGRAEERSLSFEVM